MAVSWGLVAKGVVVAMMLSPYYAPAVARKPGANW